MRQRRVLRRLPGGRDQQRALLRNFQESGFAATPQPQPVKPTGSLSGKKAAEQEQE